MTDRYGIASKQCNGSIIMIMTNITICGLREPFKGVKVKHPPWIPCEMLTNLVVK